MYEIFEKLCKMKGITTYRFCKDMSVSSSTISTWKKKRTIARPELAKKVCDYFGVSMDYLMTGKELDKKETSLTSRDERDIAKDLDRIMNEIRNSQNGPLYYNGNEIDEASISLLQNAIEYALVKTKEINKVKYNPNKNKK